MTARRELRLSVHALAGAAIAFMGIGASAIWLLTVSRGGQHVATPVAGAPALPPGANPSVSSSPGDVSITLTADTIARAGLVIVPVTSAGSDITSLRVPGTVQVNANKQVIVTSLASGRVTGVRAAVGDRVVRGQSLALIDSPDLADAQARYLSARAELDAHERELERTQRLVEIGAASRQELERAHAQHTTQRTAVQSARARLRILGMSTHAVDTVTTTAQLAAVVDVPAPLSGVVTERNVNPGQNVDATMPLFTVTDLSTVWVVGDVYDKDLAGLRIGSNATVSVDGRTVQGHVTYVDPQARPESRTARVRLELPNADGSLRPGRYVDVSLAEVRGSSHAPSIPTTAIQMLGEHAVVYIVDAANPQTFLERRIEIADTRGTTALVEGVRPGDRVVAEGSFLLRAEVERLGLRKPSRAAQAVRITVDADGFSPARVEARAHERLRLIFVRTSAQTCATSVDLPALKIHRELPINTLVAIDVTPERTEPLEFACGMKMFHGKIVVQ